jgi:transcription elongation factor Elf1
MLQQINETLVFYFTIECANCHHEMSVSHAVIEEKSGELFCTLCGKTVTVPDWQTLCSSAKTLNDYIGDKFNAQYINIVLNENFEAEEEEVAAH